MSCTTKDDEEVIVMSPCTVLYKLSVCCRKLYFLSFVDISPFYNLNVSKSYRFILFDVVYESF